MEHSALPNYVVPPGAMIEEWLDENEMTQAALARRMGVSGKHVSTLVNGLSVLSPDIAYKLELVTGIDAVRWLSLEALYQADKVRLAARPADEDVKQLISEFPLADLRKLGFITNTMKRPGEVVVELLAFFGVASVDHLRDMVRPAHGYAYRSAARDVQWASRNVWLRLGELAADSIELPQKYDRTALSGMLDELRKLVPTPPEHFGIELASRLARVGVRLVYVREVKGTRAYGATRWYRSSPLIQLSLRRKDDGQFWFTLFHELAHLLYHADRQAILIHDVDEDRLNEAEREADAFSRDFLIPPDAWARVGHPRALNEVKVLAASWGVSPGVVVGRLHHEKKWDHTHGRGLYKTLEIAEAAQSLPAPD